MSIDYTTRALLHFNTCEDNFGYVGMSWVLTRLLVFAEQQQGWEELGWVRDKCSPWKEQRMVDVAVFLLLLVVGSMWLNSQTGGWLAGPCQCVSVSANPDKATDTTQTENILRHLRVACIGFSIWGFEKYPGSAARKKILDQKERAAQPDSLPLTTHSGTDSLACCCGCCLAIRKKGI